MIAIVNISPADTDPEGIHTYEVRINSRIITRFRHRRSEGLAKCLRVAAAAVERKENEKIMQLLVDMEKNPDDNSTP